jgi:predicted solute-binding protein
LAGIANRAELAKGKLEKEYLTKCIRYELDREEKEGMAEFAGRSGLAMKKIEYL